MAPNKRLPPPVYDRYAWQLAGVCRQGDPVLLGDGFWLLDDPGGSPVRLELLNGADPSVQVNVRYRPVATRQCASTTSAECGVLR